MRRLYFLFLPVFLFVLWLVLNLSLIHIYVGAGGDVLAGHDGFAGADAAAGDDAAPGPHHAVDVDAHAHLQRAGEDDGVGVERVQLQHGVGRAELVQQPAGVTHAPVGHQGIEDGLVVPLSVVVAQEPFVASRCV